MSARDEAVLWLNGRKGNGAGGATAGGGNVLLKTPKHKLDGPEHLNADDTAALDATVDRHGLLPKLSGDPDAFLNGEGDFVVPSFASALDDLTDVAITSPAEDEQLQYVAGVWVNNARRWEPVTFDPGTGPEIVFTATDIVMTWETY